MTGHEGEKLYPAVNLSRAALEELEVEIFDLQRGALTFYLEYMEINQCITRGQFLWP